MVLVLMMKLVMVIVVLDKLGINYCGCIELLVVVLFYDGIVDGLLILCGGVDFDFDWLVLWWLLC